MEYVGLSFLLIFANVGLMMGLTLGAICLLRPLLKRVLSPQQRSVLWMAGWILGYLPTTASFGDLFPSAFRTFQDLIAPRTSGLGRVAAFLPGVYDGPGPYHLALPGGLLVPVRLGNWLWLLALVWVAGIAGLLVTFRKRKTDLMANVCGREVERKEALLRETPELRQENVTVWLCEGLPTSFIRTGSLDQKWVYIQEELPPERLDLVLRHEAKHIKLQHCKWKWIATFTLVMYWWNPLVWLGFRYFCQDLELACDSAVMNELPPERRKEYAQTLLELGTGRQLWEVPLSFGECDGAARVKALAFWKPRRWWKGLLGWAVTLVLILFFAGGHIKPELPLDMLLAWERGAGSVENLVLDLEQEMAETMSVPYVEVAQVWADSSDSVLWVQTENGTWYHVNYYWTSWKWHGVSGVTAAETPDLTGCEQLT